MTLLGIAESMLVGSTTGFLSGLLGIGGGIILVPLLTLIGLPIHMAIGTSLAFIACACLAGIVQHLRQGSIDLPVAFALALPAAAMSNIGAHFSGTVPPSTLFLLFSMLLLIVMVIYFFYRLPAPQEASTDVLPEVSRWYVLCRHVTVANVSYHYDVNAIKAVLSGMCAGTLSGFFGIGGGFLLVPLSVIALHMPLRVTIGTCLAVSILPAWVGTFTHWKLGHIDFALWAPLVVTGVLGSQMGARYAVRFAPRLIKGLFLLLMLAGAVYMLTKALTG